MAKKGPDKGAMTFSRSGKCHKGEKKLSWKKKGKPADRPPARGPGRRGRAGSPASCWRRSRAAGEDDQTLTTQVDTLITQLDALTTQLNAVKARVNGLTPRSPRSAARCRR